MGAILTVLGGWLVIGGVVVGGTVSRTVSIESRRWSRSRLSRSLNSSYGCCVWCGELLCEHDEPWPLSDDESSISWRNKISLFIFLKWKINGFVFYVLRPVER